MYEELKKQMDKENKESLIKTEEVIQRDEDASKHIFVVGALGAGKSTTMSVLFDPTEAATE